MDFDTYKESLKKQYLVISQKVEVEVICVCFKDSLVRMQVRLLGSEPRPLCDKVLLAKVDENNEIRCLFEPDKFPGIRNPTFWAEKKKFFDGKKRTLEDQARDLNLMIRPGDTLHVLYISRK